MMGIYSYLVSRYCLRKKITKRMLSILQYKTPFAIEWTTLDENILIIDRLCPLHLLRYALCALYASPRYGDEWKWWFCCCFFYIYMYLSKLIDNEKKTNAQILPPILTQWSVLWNLLQDFRHGRCPCHSQILFGINRTKDTREANKIWGFYL